MNKTTTFIAFLTGVTVGSIATWKLLKTKYEQIAQEEIDSVKEAFLRNYGDETIDEIPDESEPINGIDEKPDLSIYTAKLKEQGYLVSDPEKEEEDEDMTTKPYVISPDDFGDLDYKIVSLIYYADKILADYDGNVIEDVDRRIGKDSLTHFGEYDEDSVYVRNDELKTDYEIVLDLEKYSNLFPRPLEEE